MKFRKTRPQQSDGKVTFQRIWIKVKECPVPISVDSVLQPELRGGDTLTFTFTADELIQAVGSLTDPEMVLVMEDYTEDDGWQDVEGLS